MESYIFEHNDHKETNAVQEKISSSKTRMGYKKETRGHSQEIGNTQEKKKIGSTPKAILCFLRSVLLGL